MGAPLKKGATIMFNRIFINISRSDIADELRRRLSKGIVCFTYRTKNGYRRRAIGTRNLDLARRLGYYVPSPNSECGRHNPNCYFDLEKGWWRAFCPQNVVNIEG